MQTFCRLLAILIFTFSAAVASAETSAIGALAELSGSFARFGEDCRRGYEIAGIPFKKETPVFYGDNQNDPKAAIGEFRHLVNSEHINVLVTTRSPVGLALNPLSLQQKIPLVGVVGHPRFLTENPYAIRVFPSAVDEATVLASYVKSKNEERIAIVSVEDEYFLALKDQFEKQDWKKGQIVFSETVAPTQQDFSSVLVRIRETNPTAILVNLGPAQTPQLIKKVKDNKLDVDLYANFIIGMGDVRSALGELGEGIVFAELDYEKPNFLAAVHKRFGDVLVSPIGYSCYVGLTYANNLARTAKEKDIAVYSALPLINKISTLDGEISFVDREAKLSVVPKIIRAGSTVKL